ncbi:MAG: hypothetical protein ACRCWJ_02565 [Casimicrobium sp.]
MLLKILAWLLLFVSVPASAEVHSWIGERFEKTVSIAPGKVAEVCADFAKNDRAQWAFSSSANVAFNIHRHQGKEVVFDTKQANSASLNGELISDSKHEWCWMWTNETKAVVTVRPVLIRTDNKP